MKVYIVTRHNWSEETAILGLYTTRDKALKVVKEEIAENNNWGKTPWEHWSSNNTEDDTWQHDKMELTIRIREDYVE